MTDWNKIKITPKLEADYQISSNRNFVDINGYNIPISDNGIEVEWWDNPVPRSELEAIIPETTRMFQDIETIHQMTGGILEYAFTDHTVDNMVSQEVNDWLSQRGIEPVGSTTELPPSFIESEAVDDTVERLSIGKFFGITVNEENKDEYIECINKIMLTEHDDNIYLKKIMEMNDLSELGDPRNRRVLNYVEAKVIKFILVDVEKIGECFDIVYITNEICENGMTENSIELLRYFLSIDKNSQNLNEEHMKVVSERLLKYMPDVIQQIINIAEYYEKKQCNGEIHKNTVLLKTMYDNILKNTKSSIDLPNLGIMQFFESFQQNIFTKIILLIFIAYISSQLLSLFKVTYNINK